MTAIVVLVAFVTLVTTARAAIGPGPCGTGTTPPAIWDHVVWIWFENHDYGEIVGSGAAPFLGRTLSASCGLATNYHAIGHPSLPNYIAATSGLGGDALAPFSGDCNARGPCRIGAESLFAQAPSWGAYAESMRRPCKHAFTWPYAASHNPAVYYKTLADCDLHDVNLHALATDLAADALPAFVFITPNMCHSMHSCAVGAGDRWLRHVMALLTGSPEYRQGTTAIFVTFDESDGGDNHVATVVVSPSTPNGARSDESFTHYSLLRTTEEMLGLQTFLGRASHARSMRAAFHL